MFLEVVSLSVPFLICGVICTCMAVFLLHLFIIFGVSLPAYLSNHNSFLKEHLEVVITVLFCPHISARLQMYTKITV